MSIIERSNPLNLSYQICIVSGASSPLGTIVCKTLLKANAFVYGVDSHPKHESLNAGMAMHFGFEECDLSDAGVAEQIITGAKTKHRKDRIDVLVNVIEDGTESEWKGISNLSKAVGEIMADEGKGRMINVVGSEKVSKDEAISLSKKIGEQHKGVICNVVVSSSGKSSNGRIARPCSNRYDEQQVAKTQEIGRPLKGSRKQNPTCRPS